MQHLRQGGSRKLRGSVLCAADGNSIRDASILEVQDRVEKQCRSARNVVIVEDADTMTQRAQNRLFEDFRRAAGEFCDIPAFGKY